MEKDKRDSFTKIDFLSHQCSHKEQSVAGGTSSHTLVIQKCHIDRDSPKLYLLKRCLEDLRNRTGITVLLCLEIDKHRFN